MARDLTYRIRDRYDSLNRVGIGVDYYQPYRNPKGEVGFHRHDVIEMAFLVRGTATHYIGDTEYPEKPGSLGIIHYGERHVVVTPARGAELYGVLLDPRQHPLPVLPGRLGDCLPAIVPLDPFLRHKLNRIVHLQFPDPAPVAALLAAIVREQQIRGPEHAEAILAYYRLFLIECARLMQSQGALVQPTSAHPATRTVEDLRRRLDLHYAKPHGLCVLARECGYHPSYLCRAFRRHTGLSLMQYLLRQRLQAAMIHLRSSDEKILSVAIECGFGDIGHFNRKFKALVGVSPRRYRRRFRKERELHVSHLHKLHP